MSYDFDCYCKDLPPHEVCVFCDCVYSERVRNLVNNLVAAAALCRAFDLGGRHEMWLDSCIEGFFDAEEDHPYRWAPLCGWAAS